MIRQLFFYSFWRYGGVMVDIVILNLIQNPPISCNHLFRHTERPKEMLLGCEV